MKPQCIILTFLCVVLFGHPRAQAQDMDKELSVLTEKLAAQITDHGKKKVAVLDFTDLQGSSSEFGKYIAEELTVNLVMEKRQFSVLDRANLKSILAEHKLTATGLVDPENAKKLGQFAGVDAIILGTIIPKGQNISLTAKIITTDTAEIVGAAKADFKADETVQKFMSTPTTPSQAPGSLADDATQVTKSFGDLRVGLQTLRIVDGGRFELTMTLTNQNPKRSIWVALSCDMYNNLKANITDSNSSQFQGDWSTVSGVEYALNSQYGYQGPGFYKATEIKPGDSISATTKFVSRANRAATAGQCSLQLELLLGSDFADGHGRCTAQNLVCKIEAK
jgi:TolB-like protein